MSTAWNVAMRRKAAQNGLDFHFKIIKKNISFFDKNVRKIAKNFEWLNSRVREGFFKEKMTNPKVFTAKACKTCR